MTRYAIDAPTLLHLVDNDLDPHPTHQLVAPNLIRSEALNLLLADVRSGRRTEPEALKMHDALTQVKLRLLGDRVSRVTAWRIARELNWDLHEAEYLAIARLQADAFVSVDPARATGAAEVLSVAPLGALLTDGAD